MRWPSECDVVGACEPAASLPGGGDEGRLLSWSRSRDVLSSRTDQPCAMPRPRNRDCGVDRVAAINEAACAGPGGRFVTTSDRQAGAPMDHIVITDELESRGERPNSQ